MTKENLDWLTDRLNQYAEAIGRIKATLSYADMPPSRRLERIGKIIEEMVP